MVLQTNQFLGHQPFLPSLAPTAAGLHFQSLDPLKSGVYVLANADNSRLLTVWQNLPNWSDVTGTSFNVTVPNRAQKVRKAGEFVGNKNYFYRESFCKLAFFCRLGDVVWLGWRARAI